MSKASDKKALADLKDLAESQGWRVRLLDGGHYRWMPPNSDKVIHTASTPSDHRALDNIKAILRRNGLDLPRK